jgi:hypothetical protein
MIGGKQAASSGRQYYICTTQINCRIPTQIKFQSDHESDSVYVLLVIALVGCSLFFISNFPISRFFCSVGETFLFSFELDRCSFVFLLCFQRRRWGLPMQLWKVTEKPWRPRHPVSDCCGYQSGWGVFRLLKRFFNAEWSSIQLRSTFHLDSHMERSSVC